MLSSFAMIDIDMIIDIVPISTHNIYLFIQEKREKQE